MSQFFAADNKIKIDLQRAVEAVKQDKLVVQSLTESVVIGDTPINHNLWYSSVGISLEISLIAITIRILNSIYLFFRLSGAYYFDNDFTSKSNENRVSGTTARTSV